MQTEGQEENCTCTCIVPRNVFQLRHRGCAASTSFSWLSLVLFEECK